MDTQEVKEEIKEELKEENKEEMDEAVTQEEEKEEDTQKGKYMTFCIGREYYGIAIEYVNEIIGMLPITKVPELEDYIMGLINLRGKIVPVIDVRARFRKEMVPYNKRTCIIVVKVKTDVVGLIVDTIAEVATIAESDILPPPKAGSNADGTNRFVYGIGKAANGVKLLLDPEKLLNNTVNEEEKEAEEE